MTDSTQQAQPGSPHPNSGLHRLAEHTRGPVYTPTTDGYDQERTGFQRHTTHRPAVIVGATGDRDVGAAVRFAAAHEAPIAVQASGHGLARPLRNGVLISTRRMSGVRVNPRARTAWVEAGATWQQVIDASAPHGLAPLSGSFPGVGAVSYTLGGGVGLMARRYGFAADHVRRIDLVTADGHRREVTATSEPDLFWALRGGGGNFGVVTGMEIDLLPQSRIYGGGLFFDVERSPHVLQRWREWTTGVPDEMTSAVAMLPFPDLPMVPEALRGRHVAQVQVCYLGPAEEGERLVRPLRQLGPSLRDTLRELPYAESGSVFDEPDEPHVYLGDNRLLDDLEPEALATLPTLAGPSAPVMCVVGIRHLGGPLARPPRTTGAVGHRDAAYALGVLSVPEPGTDDPESEETVRAVHHEIFEQCSTRVLGRSLNFSFGPLDPDQVRAGFDPADYHRLTELKAAYDPAELFRSNHPIPPADTYVAPDEREMGAEPASTDVR